MREGLYTQDARSAGTLFFGARWTPDSPFSLRLGFAHHHEVPWTTLLEHPVWAAAGTAPGIRHRSGVELGAGWRAPLDALWEPGRLGLGVEASVAWLPDSGGPQVYGFLDLLLTLDLGRRLAE